MPELFRNNSENKKKSFVFPPLKINPGKRFSINIYVFIIIFFFFKFLYCLILVPEIFRNISGFFVFYFLQGYSKRFYIYIYFKKNNVSEIILIFVKKT